MAGLVWLHGCAVAAAGIESGVVPPAVVHVPAGEFTRGSDAAERQAAYRLDEQAYGHRQTRVDGWYEAEPARGTAYTGAFSITRTPITQRQYAAFVAATGHRAPSVTLERWQAQGLRHSHAATRRFAWRDGVPAAARADHPVVLVSWHDARAYAAWLSRQTGRRWQLPTEAQWEKAARGSDGRRFPWGDEFDATRLNSHDAGPFDTVPVGSHPDGASPFGVLDAAGQVYEWTADGAGQGARIVKGGSWDDRGCGVCRPAARHGRPADLVHILIGFRLVSEPSTPAQAPAKTFEPLVPLARVGPWSAVSGLIGYGERLWFVNSVKFVNHNSADLYSYDPRSRGVRYERHLFSQDAGQATVHQGRLYWPFEDPRSSVGRAEYMLTDGRLWQWRDLPFERALHLHAMQAHDGSLYASTGGFVAALYRSQDGGARWSEVYRHDNPPGQISRMVSLGQLDGRLYAGLETSEETDAPLMMTVADRLVPVPGWPRGTNSDALTAYRGQIYAIHQGAQGNSVWRTDGRRSEPVPALSGRSVRAMAADAQALWALTASGGRGALWRSSDGRQWSRVQAFEGDEPVDMAIHAGGVYVGAIGGDGRGVLYGPRQPAESGLETATAPASVPLPAENADDARALDAPLRALDAALADMPGFEGRGGVLLQRLEPVFAARSRAAASALASRIGRVRGQAGQTSRFVGRQVPVDEKVDWQLLWALAHNRRGGVPLALLEEPWRAPRHGSEKYTQTPAGAAWAVAQSRQDDDATVRALVARLDRAGDPDWLAGDMVGALTAISGCRFGYDARAWREWAAARARGGAGTCDTRGATGSPELLRVPAGTFTMGDRDGEADEAPRRVTLRPFTLMRTEVTNREFREFVAATAYVTDAQRSGEGHVWTDRWRAVRGADWLDPQGEGAGIDALDTHPVVQVSARDAAAYCAWRGLRLPTEEEWEFAARGDTGRRYPWGDVLDGPRGQRRANYGTQQCCAADASDGHRRTGPVGQYPDGASPFGLLDMAGNVWEWTSSRYAAGGDEVAIRGGGWGNNPYCLRASYRHGNPPDIGLDMVGVRCAGPP